MTKKKKQDVYNTVMIGFCDTGCLGPTRWRAGGLDDVLVSSLALLQVSGQTPVGLLSFHHLHAVIGLQLLHLAGHAL